MSNHLTNVLITLSDKVQGVSTGGNANEADYYEALVASANDYYPFGLAMPGRKDAQDYRYGFNGKENDKAWGTKWIQDYGFRLYNPSIVRFLSVDPLTNDFPELTPYQFASNTPIQAIDLDGLESTFFQYKLEKDNSGRPQLSFTGESRTSGFLYNNITQSHSWGEEEYVRVVEYNGQHFSFSTHGKNTQLSEYSMDRFDKFLEEPDLFTSDEQKDQDYLSKITNSSALAVAMSSNPLMEGKPRIKLGLSRTARNTSKTTTNSPAKSTNNIHKGVNNNGQKGTKNKEITNKFPNEPFPKDGKFINHKVIDGNIKVPNGVRELDFVITKKGELLLGKKHHLLGNKENVLAAGQLKLNGKGKVRSIDNFSGHYRPTGSDALNFPKYFKKLGINVKGATLNRSDFHINSDGFVIGQTKYPSQVIK